MLLINSFYLYKILQNRQEVKIVFNIIENYAFKYLSQFFNFLNSELFLYNLYSLLKLANFIKKLRIKFCLVSVSSYVLNYFRKIRLSHYVFLRFFYPESTGLLPEANNLGIFMCGSLGFTYCT